jgi:hypothetical protein
MRRLHLCLSGPPASDHSCRTGKQSWRPGAEEKARAEAEKKRLEPKREAAAGKEEKK